MFEAHADIAIGADAKVIADGILDTLDEPALKRMASCHGLKTQVPGMSASGGRSTGGKERLKTILKGHRASCNCKHKDQLTLWKSAHSASHCTSGVNPAAAREMRRLPFLPIACGNCVRVADA